jgi:hypothetical protein
MCTLWLAAVLVNLLRNGLPAPSAADVAAHVTNARLAAWLHEPHLVQVLSRQIVSVTLHGVAVHDHATSGF